MASLPGADGGSVEHVALGAGQILLDPFHLDVELGGAVLQVGLVLVQPGGGLLVDLVLKAYAYEVSKQLSIFVGLIITNCIVLGRLEAFALSNRPWPSFLDALGNGIGYALVIVIVGFFRELLGAGSLLGVRIFPEGLYAAGYMDNGLMVLAPGAFLILGVIIWIQRSITGYREEE